MRILLIEDDRKLNHSLKYQLEKENFTVDVCFDGEEALFYINQNIHDCILLDRMIPAIDGTQLLTLMRGKNNSTPVILITALGTLQDKITGLDSGADDYLVKPFDFEELLARIRCVTRRSPLIHENDALPFGDLTLHVTALDLHAARTHADDFAHAPHCLPVELLLGSLVQQVGGIENPAATPGDFLVAQSVDFVQKLLLAAPGVDQMGVRIAERREKHPALGIDHPGRDARTAVVHAAESGNPPVFGEQPRIVEGLQTVHLGPAQALTPRKLDADELADVLNERSHDAGIRRRCGYGDT